MSPTDLVLALLAWCLLSVPVALALGWALSRRRDREASPVSRVELDTAA